MPYVGITGFRDEAEVLDIDSFFRRQPDSPRRRLHVGVMMSYKTLNDIPTKWSKVFPPTRQVSEIFFSSFETMNCLHYADYDDMPDLAKHLYRAIEYAGPGVTALQLDMIWPAPHEVANAVHMSRKNLEVILQLNSKALEMVGNDPKKMLAKLADYETVIQYVLLDKSAGQGLGLDAESLRPFLAAIRDQFPNLGLAVAGGLGPDTMQLVEPLLVDFPDLSWDAQSRLTGNGSAMQPLDQERVKKYLGKSLSLSI